MKRWNLENPFNPFKKKYGLITLSAIFVTLHFSTILSFGQTQTNTIRQEILTYMGTSTAPDSRSSIKKDHLSGARAYIDMMRARCAGLGPYAWDDSLIIPGVTRVRAIHFQQLKSAFNQIYSTGVGGNAQTTLAGWSAPFVVNTDHTSSPISANDLTNTLRGLSASCCGDGVCSGPETAVNCCDCAGPCPPPVFSPCSDLIYPTICGPITFLGIASGGSRSANCRSACTGGPLNATCTNGTWSVTGSCTSICNSDGTCDTGGGEDDSNCRPDCTCSPNSFTTRCGAATTNGFGAVHLNGLGTACPNGCSGDFFQTCSNNTFINPDDQCMGCNNDNICEPTAGENCMNCFQDCSSLGTWSGTNSCGPVSCGSNVCAVGEQCQTESSGTCSSSYRCINDGTCTCPDQTVSTACGNVILPSTTSGDPSSVGCPAGCTGGVSGSCDHTAFIVSDTCVLICNNDSICDVGENAINCSNDCGTCSDTIQNQGETDVDCGGPCSACCGNNICNASENATTCAGDCHCNATVLNSNGCSVSAPSADNGQFGIAFCSGAGCNNAITVVDCYSNTWSVAFTCERCGDGSCTAGENNATCPAECP